MAIRFESKNSVNGMLHASEVEAIKLIGTTFAEHFPNVFMSADRVGIRFDGTNGLYNVTELSEGRVLIQVNSVLAHSAPVSLWSVIVKALSDASEFLNTGKLTKNRSEYKDSLLKAIPDSTFDPKSGYVTFSKKGEFAERVAALSKSLDIFSLPNRTVSMALLKSIEAAAARNDEKVANLIGKVKNVSNGTETKKGTKKAATKAAQTTDPINVLISTLPLVGIDNIANAIRSTLSTSDVERLVSILTVKVEDKPARKRKANNVATVADLIAA